jgi:hypothetical protein
MLDKLEKEFLKVVSASLVVNSIGVVNMIEVDVESSGVKIVLLGSVHIKVLNLKKVLGKTIK